MRCSRWTRAIRFKSAAFEFALICARQNMKTALFKMAALGWLFITDQRLVVWSAHEMGTTKEAFRDLVNLIENCSVLRKRLASGPTNGIFSGNGNELIELAPTPECPDGQRIKFKARTHSGGRGLSGDKVILDEAMFLQPQHMGSLLPTLSARPDPQVCYGASAGLEQSEVLRGIRDRGRPGSSPRLAYMEFCAPENICVDSNCSHAVDAEGCALDDIEYVRMANPALGRRISIQYIRDERQALAATPQEYARERLGWWDKPDESDQPHIQMKTWMDLTDVNSTPDGMVAFGVYTNINRTTSAIAVAGKRADGKFHVGVVPAVRGKQIDSLPGTAWIPDRLKELSEHKPCAVVVDGHSAAASLIPDIERQGVTVTKSNGTDFAKACGAFDDAVTQNNMAHRGATPLARAVTSARKRELNDAWAWDRKDRGSDITQLNAVTLALHGLINFGQPQEVWGFFT